jgi:hypothetical protein
MKGKRFIFIELELLLVVDNSKSPAYLLVLIIVYLVWIR